jgi:hypothetical protein
LKEFLVFSAGLIFETVLLGVRNKIKNVLDELNMYEYYIWRPKMNYGSKC